MCFGVDSTLFIAGTAIPLCLKVHRDDVTVAGKQYERYKVTFHVRQDTMTELGWTAETELESAPTPEGVLIRATKGREASRQPKAAETTQAAK